MLTTLLIIICSLGVGLLLGYLLARALDNRRPGDQDLPHEPQGKPEKDSALQQLSKLTGGLAHEIRNPLSTLKVNLQLLAEDWQEPDQQDDLPRRSVNRLEAMIDQVDLLNDTLNDFLRFLTQHKLNRHRHDLNQLAEELIEFYRPQAQIHNVRILTSLDADPLVCSVDADLFKQALLNLMINAQQAMPEGGELIIRTARQARDAQITITDTGTGIEEGNLSQIFHAYFSTKSGGTGLGLATTQKIITQHGGDIQAHSEPGKGTSFVVTLPLAQTPG